jgi:hypothetical protein
VSGFVTELGILDGPGMTRQIRNWQRAIASLRHIR